MSTIIRAATLSKRGDAGGSVDHAVRAAEECIKKSGIDRQDIDLLINTGVYRDQNIAEPAIATLIQKELGVNPDPVPSGKSKTTLSFDLFNGACGFLYAARVADSMMRTREKKHVLVVSSESHPSKHLTPGFPYTHIGSAVLLEQSKNGQGFKNFMFETSRCGQKSYTGYIDIWNAERCGCHGRDVVTIDIAPDYTEKLEELALKAIKKHIESGDIKPSEINLLITSQYVPDFGVKIARSIGREGIPHVSTYKEFGTAGASDLVIGYCMTEKADFLKKGDKILFVGAGSGITTALAVYEV